MRQRQNPENISKVKKEKLLALESALQKEKNKFLNTLRKCYPDGKRVGVFLNYRQIFPSRGTVQTCYMDGYICIRLDTGGVKRRHFSQVL